MLLTEKELDNIVTEAKRTKNCKIFKERVQESVTAHFENLSLEKDEIPVLRERLYKMIDYAIGRYDHYDAKRHKFMNIGLSLIGISTTVIGLFLKYNVNVSLFGTVIGILAFGILFIAGFWMLKIFNDFTSANYPYRHVMNIHSWYFKYKFNDGLYYKLSTVKTKAAEQLGDVSKNYMKAAKIWTDNATRDKYFLKEDFEQVVILQFLQKFGSDCVKQMKKKLNQSLICFAIGFTLFVFVELFMKIFEI